MGDQAAKAKPEKVVPPSPPRVIQDEASGASFTRVGFLGEVRAITFLSNRVVVTMG